jgi:peptidoglycan/LPS O-acetylase OafA/YrhL
MTTGHSPDGTLAPADSLTRGAPGLASRPAKIAALTGIRGFAACWVFSFHIWQIARGPVLKLGGIDFTPLLACGWAGVDLFFVLSGFVLTWHYVDQAQHGVAFADFMHRRALRVVPAYYAQFLILVILAAVGVSDELPSIANTLAHLLFVHNFSFSWWDPLPKAWWTLPVEWQFYLVFPLLLAAFARYNPWRVLPALIALVVVWRVGAMAWIQHDMPQASIDHRVWLIEQLPGRIDQFAVGMATAWATMQAWPRLADSARRRLSSWLVIGGGLAALALAYAIWARADVFWQGNWLLYSWHLFMALALAMVIAGTTLGGKLATRLLGNRPILWLGEISYSIYLWNIVILLALASLGVFADLSGAAGVVRVALYSVVPVMLVSALSWWLCERPFLHYRDAHPEDSLGQRLAAFIRFPWPGLALVGSMIFAVVILGQIYWRPDAATRAQCTERGAVDGPRQLRGEQADARVSGWLHDWSRTDRVRRVVAVRDGQVIAEAMPNQARPDVAAALPLCNVERPGFELPLPLANLGLASATISIEAQRTSGARYRIGEVEWHFVPIAQPAAEPKP